MTTFAGSFRYIIHLYHDGYLVNSTKMWFGDELTAYIDKLESEGYTKAYSEDEVVKAQKKYEYLLERQLVKTNNPSCFYDLVFAGVDKKYIGCVNVNNIADVDPTNSFGYYKDGEENVFFVTDSGGDVIVEHRIEEGKNIQYFIDEFLCKHHLININEQLVSNPDKFKKIFSDYVMNRFGFKDWESQWMYFENHYTTLVELLYFIMFNNFVFDKYADKTQNYTVKRLCQTTNMEIFDAFRFMIFMIESSDEALENLKKKVNVYKTNIYDNPELKE